MPISLPNAVVGSVVTRFPPEPSWMLDLGHCKASLMNQYIATQFKGKWILRFDDTNPKTCSRANVDAYMQDLPLLNLQPDRITYASDYFQAMIDTASGLLEAGFLYADDTPTEQMRAQRMAKQASPQRNRSPQDSLAAWAEMRAGSEAGQRFCLRFKLDPSSENGALRDPVAWRGINEPHYKTGTQYKVYPTYDFAAPWLDLAEGVTHALRTLEFRDRDVLYNAVQQAILKLHPDRVASNIWEFPRIHMSYTPQAKVHQKALLAAGLVDGPADPRLPTLRGLMRAGCHPDALKAFLLEQVSPARKETYHSWDKLWTLNRRLLDPTSARHMAVNDTGRVLLTLLDGPTEAHETEVAWKQGHVVKVVPYKQVWIDQEDAQVLNEGDEVTLLAWGNAIIQSVTHTEQQTQQQQQQQQQQQRVEPAADADVAVCTQLDQQVQQQQQLQQQHKQKQAAASGKPPLAPHTPPLCSPPPAAAPAAVAPAGRLNDAANEGNISDVEAAAAFWGYKDVFAMRDALQTGRKGGWGSSSCASTAGSNSVAALGSLLSETEEGPQVAAEQAFQAVTLSPIKAQQQQQQQQQQSQGLSLPQQEQQQQGPPHSGEVPGSSPAVVSITAVLNTAGSPKASKLKIHWLPALPHLLLPLRLVRFGHPVLVERVTEEVDVIANFNHSSRVEAMAWGDPSLLQSAQRGNVVQLQRKGFYVADQVLLKEGTSGGSSNAASCATDAAAGAANGQMAALCPGAVTPIGAEAAAAAGQAPLKLSDIQEVVLFYIPDGHTKHEEGSGQGQQ